jgi:hypothetical protein
MFTGRIGGHPVRSLFRSKIWKAERIVPWNQERREVETGNQIKERKL